MKTNYATKIYVLLLVSAMTYSSFTSRTPFVKEGTWLATFTIDGREVPFNFEVRGTSAENARIYLRNATELVELEYLIQRDDSLFIPMEPYGAILEARIEKNVLTGVFRRLSTEQPSTTHAFRAEYGKKFSFTENADAPKNTLSTLQSNAFYLLASNASPAL
ncbi:MAG: hypothetical protein V4714_20055 [Bacteroidota bacterium]